MLIFSLIQMSLICIVKNVDKHIAFGHGVHKCLGSRIAKMQLRLAFERIFERFPEIAWTGKQKISPNALVHCRVEPAG